MIQLEYKNKNKNKYMKKTENIDILDKYDNYSYDYSKEEKQDENNLNYDIKIDDNKDFSPEIQEKIEYKNEDLYYFEELEKEEWYTFDEIIKNFDEIKENKSKNKKNSLLSSFLFLIKYLLSSTIIFFILLLVTNYSSYINIAKSYLYIEEIEKETDWLISSINANKIDDTEEKNLSSEEEYNSAKDSKSIKKENKYSIKKLLNESEKKLKNIDIEITPYSNRVVIPKLWKNIPLLDIENSNIKWEKELENIFMEELKNWIIRYPGSSIPWQLWNTFIFWHSSNFPWAWWSFNNVFALLDNLTNNDEVYIYYWQKKYTYKIKEKKVIFPWDTSILKRNNNIEELTLMTCRPIWTTLNRLLVIWELIKE